MSEQLLGIFGKPYFRNFPGFGLAADNVQLQDVKVPLTVGAPSCFSITSEGFVGPQTCPSVHIHHRLGSLPVCSSSFLRSNAVGVGSDRGREDELVDCVSTQSPGRPGAPNSPTARESHEVHVAKLDSPE